MQRFCSTCLRGRECEVERLKGRKAESVTVLQSMLERPKSQEYDSFAVHG